MLVRLRTWWVEVQESLWFIPTILTLIAIGLAALTVWIDGLLLARGRVDVYLAFGGGAEGARGVLSAIAGSLVTVTGVVFSITIVALQLASSQFSPRVLRNFTGDRANQAVLGTFIATFTYTLLVLRTVRSAGEDAMIFVPSISVTIAILLAMISIGLLIFYIHHAARSIQAAVIIERVTNDVRGLVDRLFPDPVGEPVSGDSKNVIPPTAPTVVRAEHAGYLQVIDEDALFRLQDRTPLAIRMEPRVGEFVLPGSGLASVWSLEPPDDEMISSVRRAFVLGTERTLQHDIELGFRQLADIALKALSPGINDPTTATTCIDRLAEILVLLGNRRMPAALRTSPDGHVHLLAQETTFGRAVALSFNQIRHFGAADATVATHLLATLERIAILVPPDRRDSLLEQANAALRAARHAVREPLDLTRIEQAFSQNSFGVLTPKESDSDLDDSDPGANRPPQLSRRPANGRPGPDEAY
ncbi:MAG: DUF2254 domain-containing protein [Chloroflexota bacterium]